ncbi:MAG TPA: glycosyltransferase [Polyangia bacterium]|nr:glycosyltransferase [Polyangia bacterium]
MAIAAQPAGEVATDMSVDQRPMLIAQLYVAYNERNGDWFYRIHSPGRALGTIDGVWAVDAPHIHRTRRALIDQADVLIINMVPDVDLRPLIARRRSRGQVTVFELNDDVADLHPLNPYSRFYSDPYEVTKLRQLLHACDAVQFSTPELKRLYGRFARRRAVFVNQMPPRTVERPARDGQASDKIVVGWGGSAGHLPDLNAVAPALIRWLRTQNRVSLHIMGDPALYDVFARLPAQRRVHVPIGDIHAYYRFVSSIDIGLAPLADTGFNRCRSDVKFLEYAQHGAVAVVQDLAPYRDTVRDGQTGMLVDSPDALVAALARLAREPDTRAAIAARARTYVDQERTEAVGAHARVAFYRLLLAEARSAAGTDDGAAMAADRESSLWRTLQACDGVEGTGRHLSLGFGVYEGLINRALLLGGQQRPEEALPLLERAVAMEPGAYQPHLFAALFSKREGRRLSLERALQREPQSLSCWIDLGDELEAAGDATGALRAYTAAVKADPTCDQAYAKASLLLTKLGRPAEAGQFGAIAHQIQKPFVA